MTGHDHQPTRVTVREAKQADRAVIKALQKLLPAPAPGLAELGFAEPGTSTVLVAERDSIIGYTLAFPADTADGRVIYIAELVVAPGARREGVGTRLVEALLEWFPESVELRLTARADDDQALAFYRTAGFTQIGELSAHYGDVAGILLARSLRT